MADTIDHSLASNWFTALAPRPDLAIGHGLKYFTQQLGASIADIGAALSRLRGGTAPAVPLTPPGDVRPHDAPASEPHPPTSLAKLRCAETGRLHPELPPGRCQEMIAVMRLAEHVYRPQAFPVRPRPSTPEEVAASADAFLHRVPMPGLGVRERPALLPPALMNSSLLNAGLGPLVAASERATAALGGEPLPVPGQVQHHFPNTLHDPKTGFTALVTVNPQREVTVTFGGAGNQRNRVGSGVRAVLNVLGLTPPKSFDQAALMTRLLKQHLASVNRQLASAQPAQPAYTLKLAGHCMGGAMATYAALRNDVDATVIAPLRLGLLARARVGREGMARAEARVTEVVVQTDWVADNRAARAYVLLNVLSRLFTGQRANCAGAIGKRFLVPCPTPANIEADLLRRTNIRMERIPGLVRGFDPHNEIETCLRIHEI